MTRIQLLLNTFYKLGDDRNGDLPYIINHDVGTAGPRLTRILGPEKNRVRRNRTIGGLWDYTI